VSDANGWSLDKTITVTGDGVGAVVGSALIFPREMDGKVDDIVLRLESGSTNGNAEFYLVRQVSSTENSASPPINTAGWASIPDNRIVYEDSARAYANSATDASLRDTLLSGEGGFKNGLIAVVRVTTVDANVRTFKLSLGGLRRA